MTSDKPWTQQVHQKPPLLDDVMAESRGGSGSRMVLGFDLHHRVSLFILRCDFSWLQSAQKLQASGDSGGSRPKKGRNLC